MKKTVYHIISVLTFILAMTALTIISLPLIQSYSNPEKFREYIESFGVLGFLVMLLIQIAQIIVAFIPGELVEFIAGTIYGWLGGLLLCSLGILTGQFIIFKIVRVLGKNFVTKVAGSKVMTKFKFLQDEKKLKRVIFFLFFIPGTPKDLIAYIVPLTKIKIRDFLILTLFARLPSVISSTYAGDAFADKNLVNLIVIYSIVLIFTVVGLAIYKQWEKRHKEKTVAKQ